MKHAIIGTLLILYGLFLSPAFLEPTDIVVSTIWIAAAMAANIPVFLITLWIISGYLAFIVGIALLGHSIIRRLPVIAGAKNPIALALLFIFIVSVCLWFYYVA